MGDFQVIRICYANSPRPDGQASVGLIARHRNGRRNSTPARWCMTIRALPTAQSSWLSRVCRKPFSSAFAGCMHIAGQFRATPQPCTLITSASTSAVMGEALAVAWPTCPALAQPGFQHHQAASRPSFRAYLSPECLSSRGNSPRAL